MKRLDREIKETIIFTITPRIKYTGISPTRDVQDLYVENHTAYKKDIK